MMNITAVVRQKYLAEVTARINSTPTVIPAQRKAFREGFSFSALPFDEQFAVWSYIWKHSNGFMPKAYALFFLEKYMRNETVLKQIWKDIATWQNDVDNWAICDGLAKIYTQALAIMPDKVYAQLKKWNKDKSLWKRRQSVVSLLYFHSTKKMYPLPEQITALIQPLLKDKEYYVQKGAGWAMREMYSVYPKQALAFFKANIKDISGIAFTIAIEKVTPVEREQLKLLRKKE